MFKLAFLNWMKKVPFGCSLRPSLTKESVSPPTHYPGGPDTMEGYTTRGCHMGTNKDPLAIPSSPALRTMLLFKGEGMLGS
jgi:hypothetical protein